METHKPADGSPETRKVYERPELREFGRIADLTEALPAGSGNDNSMLASNKSAV